jgi:DNA-binding beta-propeller fold protein YncE
MSSPVGGLLLSGAPIANAATLTSVPVGTAHQRVGVDPGTDTIYVGNFGSNTLS